VPEGAFIMGSDELPDECPARPVSLARFSIDQDEVSQSRWDACVSDGACEAAPSCESDADWENAEALPVRCVDWEQADAFCTWAGGHLPTEAQWEKAARGTEGARFPWGFRPPACSDANYRYVAWYCQAGVIEVASYPESVSAYGLNDVAGNAWEWTADWYDAGYYRDAPDTDPGGPTESCRRHADGPALDCTQKVMRGGAWNTLEGPIRTAARSAAPPEVSDVNIGFRCAYGG
jgi:formylglycine-generating enzyme required for sulfatase activity